VPDVNKNEGTMKCVKSEGAHEESICIAVWNRRFALVCSVATPNKACLLTLCKD
jgi:hypothetical protein